MPDRYPSVLLFGAPGVGKGTQGTILGAVPGLYHMSTGEMFRSLSPDSEFGRVFTEYSTKGLLVPDETTVRLWRQHMRKHYDEADRCGQVVLLDGIPRNLRQAELMDDSLDVLLVLHLYCSDVDAMVRRLRSRALKEGRADDADERVILERYRVYEQETAPMLDHYPADIIREIDAMGTPLGVLRRIIESIDPVIAAYDASKAPPTASR